MDIAWLPGAQFNVAECALSGWDPDRPAIVWAMEHSPTQLHSMSRGQLAQRAYYVAESLRVLGLRPGDAVGLVMPMVPEAVVAFLGEENIGLLLSFIVLPDQGMKSKIPVPSRRVTRAAEPLYCFLFLSFLTVVVFR